MRGRVPPAAVMRAHSGGRLNGTAKETVEKRRLAHTGRTDKSHGNAGAQVTSERVDAVRRQRAQGVDVDPDGHALQFSNFVLDVLAKVGLVQEDHRARAALPDRREIAL